MGYLNKRLSRTIAVAYFYDQIISKDEKSIVDFQSLLFEDFKSEPIDHNQLSNLDQEYLDKIISKQRLNHDYIKELIKNVSNRNEYCIDNLLFALLQTSISELLMNIDYKLVISEYLYLCDTLDVNAAFLNGVLNKIVDKILSKDLLNLKENQKKKPKSDKKNQLKKELTNNTLKNKKSPLLVSIIHNQ